MEPAHPHGDHQPANALALPMTASIEFLESKEVWHCWNGPVDPVYEVKFEGGGGGVTVKKVETVHTSSDDTVKKWLRYMGRDHRRRLQPHVASLCCFRGHPKGLWPWESPKGPRSSLPIRTVALCLGGSHCLVYTDGGDSASERTDVAALRGFLEDPRMTVLVMGSDAEELRRKWGIDAKKAVELRGLVARAKGRDAEEKEMSRATVEAMAEMVMEGTTVSRKPQRVEQGDWGRLDQEKVLYATADAYLCFDIGVRCLRITGALK